MTKKSNFYLNLFTQIIVLCETPFLYFIVIFSPLSLTGESTWFLFILLLMVPVTVLILNILMWFYYSKSRYSISAKMAGVLIFSPILLYVLLQ